MNIEKNYKKLKMLKEQPQRNDKISERMCFFKGGNTKSGTKLLWKISITE